MLRINLSAVICICLVIFKVELSLTSTYTQTTYDKEEARQVSTYSQVLRDVSQFECGIACSEKTCVTAGYNLHTRTCFISHDDASVATITVENHWIVLVKHDVLSGIPETGEALTGYIDCGLPFDIQYGITTSNGTLVSYSCTEGYTLVGNDTAICNDGVWSNADHTPACAQVYIDLNRSIVTYGCQAGNTLVGNETATCLQGVWNASTPSCAANCGRTINYPNVDVIYEDDTTEGSRAMVSCESGYRMRNETNVMMVCQNIINDAGIVVDVVWKTTTVEPACWELMFRGTADNGDDAVSSYMDGGGLTTTTDPECMLVQNNSCTHHYRNPRLDIWETLGVRKVRYEMYNDGEAVMSFVVNATGSTYTDWLLYENDPSSWRGLEWPWEDMLPTSESLWDINKMAAYGYSFRIIRYRSSCMMPYFYTLVLFNPTNCFSNDFSTWPKFQYALNNHGANFNTEEHGLASVMAVWVYHD